MPHYKPAYEYEPLSFTLKREKKSSRSSGHRKTAKPATNKALPNDYHRRQYEEYTAPAEHFDSYDFNTGRHSYYRSSGPDPKEFERADSFHDTTPPPRPMNEVELHEKECDDWMETIHKDAYREGQLVLPMYKALYEIALARKPIFLHHDTWQYALNLLIGAEYLLGKCKKHELWAQANVVREFEQLTRSYLMPPIECKAGEWKPEVPLLCLTAIGAAANLRDEHSQNFLHSPDQKAHSRYCLNEIVFGAAHQQGIIGIFRGEWFAPEPHKIVEWAGKAPTSAGGWIQAVNQAAEPFPTHTPFGPPQTIRTAVDLLMEDLGKQIGALHLLSETPVVHTEPKKERLAPKAFSRKSSVRVRRS